MTAASTQAMVEMHRVLCFMLSAVRHIITIIIVSTAFTRNCSHSQACIQAIGPAAAYSHLLNDPHTNVQSKKFSL